MEALQQRYQTLLRPLKGEHLLMEQWCHWYFQLSEVKEPLQHLTASAWQEGVWQRLAKILIDKELRMLCQWGLTDVTCT